MYDRTGRNARVYGVAGWQDPIVAVSKRLGSGVDWAAKQARRVIHDNDVERLKQLLVAWSVINRHFDVADFLLAHGADINTRWNSHEPASILHHLVFEDNYESMQYLIDRGIDMAIEDYRWNANAIGWARHGTSDEKMAQWLEDLDKQRPPST